MTAPAPIAVKLISKRDAASRLDVCERTLDRFRARGDIVGYRIGKALKFREDDIATFIEGGREQCPSRNQPTQNSITTPSVTKASGIVALRDKLLKETQKPSKGKSATKSHLELVSAKS